MAALIPLCSLLIPVLSSSLSQWSPVRLVGSLIALSGVIEREDDSSCVSESREGSGRGVPYSERQTTYKASVLLCVLWVYIDVTMFDQFAEL